MSTGSRGSGGGRVAAGERLKRVEHRDEVLLLARDVVEDRPPLRLGHRGVAPHRVDVRAHRGERRADLVAHVAREPARRLERALGLRGRALQPGQHLVHSVRQLVHLTAGVVLR